MKRIHPGLTALLQISLSAILALSWAPARAAAQSLLFAQYSDGRSVFGPSELWPASSTDAEIADDFDVVGDIERVVADAYVTGAVSFQGVWVRFYEVADDGRPGPLQHEVFVGSPAATYTQGRVDATLPAPFGATGRHFVSLQPVLSYWYPWSAHSGAPQGQHAWFRNRASAGAWQATDSLGQSLLADVAFSLYGATTGPGTIDSLSPSPAARSAYLEIFGSNFGATGQLSIDGISAFVSTWTSNRIVAYVPEGARATDVPVTLVNPSGAPSNTVSLTVTARPSPGPNDRVRWRFRMDAPYSLVRPVLAADGTIYAVDVYGHLYALSPDGALLWLVNGAGDKGVTIGADGAIVASSETDVRSFNRDGSGRFTYTQSPRAFIDLGVAAGPDGNLYSVGTEGPGVFSLTPTGTLRWTLPESYSRPIVDSGEIVFGPNGSTGQLYFYANNHLRAVDLSGRPVFAIPGAFGQPDVAPDGSVHGPRVAYSPKGDLLWRFASPDPFGIASAPDIGADGTHYFTESQGRIFALDPAGTEKWRATSTAPIGGPVVSPGNTLLVAGGANTLDKPGSIHGLSAADGSELWQVTLPAEEPTVFNPSTGQLGFNQATFTRGRVSPDGATAYFMTATATGSNSTSRSFVYAIETGAPISPSPALAFYTLTPCRLVDTRQPSGPHGGPALAAGERTFNLAGRCGIPTTAAALAVNLTVVSPSQSGDLRVFAAGSAPPLASALNFGAGQTRTNNAILPVTTDGNGGLTVHLDMGTGTAQLIVDIVGYFQSGST